MGSNGTVNGSGNSGEIISGTIINPVEDQAPAAYLDPTLSNDPEIAALREQIANVPDEGVPFEPQGYCQVVAPAIDIEEANKIQNPAIRWAYKAPAYTLYGLGAAVDAPFSGFDVAGAHVPGIVDMHETINANGINEFTGLNDAVATANADALAAKGTPGEDSAATTARHWEQARSLASAAEFTSEAGAASWGLSWVRNRNTPLGMMAGETFGLDAAGQTRLAESLGGAAALRGADGKVIGLNTEIKLGALPWKQQAGLSGRLTKQFWTTQGWPLAMAVGLSSTGIVSSATKGLDLIDPDHEWLQGNTREAAKYGIYGGMFLGGATLINAAPISPETYAGLERYPTLNKVLKPVLQFADRSVPGYRRVAVGKEFPGAKPMPFAAGMAVTLGLMGESWWLQNVAVQERILPITKPEIYDESANLPLYQAGGAYNPGNWDWNFQQSHTSASRAFSWGVFGPVWAAMSSLQGDWATMAGNAWKKIGMGKIVEGLKPWTVSENAFVRGAGSFMSWLPKQLTATRADVALTATERAWIEEGGFFSKRARAIATGIAKGKRPGYIFNAVLTGMPAGILVSNAMGYAAGYHAPQALGGNAMRSWITSPLNSGSLSYLETIHGYGTVHGGYAVGMPMVNYPWEKCSGGYEALYQDSVELADQVENATTDQDRTATLLRLALLYKMAQGNEKQRIRNLFVGDVEHGVEGIGIDPDALLAEINVGAAG